MASVLSRRDFLRLTGAAAAGAAFGAWPRWARAVPAPLLGDKEIYRGQDLRYIGMPVGGILAGQVYLGGDGCLWLWDIFNQIKTGVVASRIQYGGRQWTAAEGANYIDPPLPTSPFRQQFSVKVNGKERPLDRSGWADVAFCGEYPIGKVEYRDPDSPVSVTLEAFSPFIPLEAETSGYPAVVMLYRMRNESDRPATVEIAGVMENPVGLNTIGDGEGVRINRYVPDACRVDFLFEPRTWPNERERPTIVFEDWSKPTFEGWTVEGTAFGKGPTAINLQAHPAKGWRGPKSYRRGAEEDHLDGDARTGRLTSRPFTISRRFIEFWITGGNHPNTACINLVVEGKVVRTETGRQTEQPRHAHFSVIEFMGKEAHLEIVDAETTFWGQIGVGTIRFVDTLKDEFAGSPDLGDMCFAFLHPTTEARCSHEAEIRGVTPERPLSRLWRSFTLPPGESQEVGFVIAWRFPELALSGLGRVGNHYATRFASAAEVVSSLRKDYRRLSHLTRAWHDAWYGGALPTWFLNRTMMSAAVLATMTCHRFENGRFYGWEGVGGCEGTCGHVWGYAQSAARLFPSLERSRRQDVDYGFAFEKTGIVNFRSEFGFGYAADAQSGYILRTYREHQMSGDSRFLTRVYPRMKKALEYLIAQDADENGVLEGKQHNTLDIDLYGPSSWLTSYYLAALRAGEEMAKETGDAAFADRCRRIFDRGSGGFVQTFWNGEYFVHRPDPKAPEGSLRYGDGCEVDQLMGQAYAAQLGLGRIVDARHTREALRAIFRNNFRQDAGGIFPRTANSRWYALPGEPGLLMCTFPHGNRAESVGPNPIWATGYYDECWTGTEHQLAGLMISEGMVDEGLAIVRAIHDRHHPSKRNPYNEVEYSDHYARSMASFGAYLAMCGYEYHGPKGHLGFAPKMTPEDFRCAFTAAEGWGVYSQKDGEYRVALRNGKLRLKTFAFECPARATSTAVWVGEKRVLAVPQWRGTRCTLTFDPPITLTEGRDLRIGAEFHFS